MNKRDLQLLEDYLNGPISSEDMESLNELLENDPAARKRYLALATMDEGLQDLAAVAPSAVFDYTDYRGRFHPSVQGTVGGEYSLFSRPVVAAAAGLIVGIFFTSAIWAATETGRQKILTLFNESFETGPLPLPAGPPDDIGAWSGDFAEITGSLSGVEPVDGKRMFRFLRADFDGKDDPVGQAGDIYRIIDLSDHASSIAGNNALTIVEAAFGSIPFTDSGRFRGTISLHALDRIPEDRRSLLRTGGDLEELSLAFARRRQALYTDQPWRSLSLEMRLPQETRFLLIGLHVTDQLPGKIKGKLPPAVEFEGQFVDDVKVTLQLLD